MMKLSDFYPASLTGWLMALLGCLAFVLAHVGRMIL